MNAQFNRFQWQHSATTGSGPRNACWRAEWFDCTGRRRAHHTVAPHERRKPAGCRRYLPRSGHSIVVYWLLSASALGGISLGIVPIVASVLGGIGGSLLGSKILARITPHWMLLLFAALQVLVAVRLIDQGLGTVLLGDVQSSVPPLWAYVGLGIFAGTLSGLFGVGGGALVLLGLAAGYGVPVSEGLAVALALNVTNALAGLVHHAREGRVLWQELTALVPTAIVGVFVGAALAHELPVDVMRVVFGGFFLFMGVLLGRKGWTAARQRGAANNA